MLDVHLDGKDRPLPNDRDGFRAIAKWFRAAKVERVILEATGRMHRALVQSLQAKGFAVCIVNPRQSRDFAKATRQFAKTDRVDARMLAAFLVPAIRMSCRSDPTLSGSDFAIAPVALAALRVRQHRSLVFGQTSRTVQGSSR